MPAYLDPMVDWGTRIGRAGPAWCHLIADTPDELHAVAKAAGLRRRWCQLPPLHATPHYDIGTERVRAAAVQAGAVECTRDEFIDLLRRVRALVAANPRACQVP